MLFHPTLLVYTIKTIILGTRGTGLFRITSLHVIVMLG